MKYSLFGYFILFFITTSVFATSAKGQDNTTDYISFNKELKNLLDQKDYFRLERQLEANKENIDDKQRLFFQCFIDNAFNHNERCIANVDVFLEKYLKYIPDSLKAKLFLLQADSYYKQFQYRNSALNDSIVLLNYATSLGDSFLAEIKNDLVARTALQVIPPQETIMNGGGNSTVEKRQAGPYGNSCRI